MIFIWEECSFNEGGEGQKGFFIKIIVDFEWSFTLIMVEFRRVFIAMNRDCHLMMG
jgi:hypothetical protein